MANNREISQFAGLVTVNDTTNDVSIGASVSIGTGITFNSGTGSGSFAGVVDSDQFKVEATSNSSTTFFSALSGVEQFMVKGNNLYLGSDAKNAPSISLLGVGGTATFASEGYQIKATSTPTNAIVRQEYTSGAGTHIYEFWNPTRSTSLPRILFDADGSAHFADQVGVGGTEASPNITLSSNGDIAQSGDIENNGGINKALYTSIGQNGTSTGTGTIRLSNLATLAGTVYRGGFARFSIAVGRLGGGFLDQQWAEFFVRFSGVSNYSNHTITRLHGDTSISCSAAGGTNYVDLTISFTRTGSQHVSIIMQAAQATYAAPIATITSAF